MHRWQTAIRSVIGSRVGWLLASTLWIATASAQSTDGYHGIQMFPVVVDTSSFVQRFNFSTPNLAPVTVKVRFYPADGTAQKAIGPIQCSDVLIPANSFAWRSSLRSLCPALTSGSAFGFLHMQVAPSTDDMQSDIPMFAAFSRVSNPQGNGFSVEAFPVMAFSSGNAVVTGLRRLAAAPNAPAFQSNCFFSSLNELPEANPGTSKRVNFTIYAGGAQFASFVDLVPGQIVRFLDIFSAVNAPPGDYDNANLVVTTQGGLGATYRPGIATFCTVQDNTSFGADFRIAKTSYGAMGVGSDDSLAAREIWTKKDVLGRIFQIDAGANGNTHNIYFRNPDTINCKLLDPITALPLPTSSGLEMRLLNSKSQVIAGGSNQTGTGDVFLGNKAATGHNGQYLIEVESSTVNTGSIRDYGLYCASGSGSTSGYELLRYKDPADRF